LAENENKDTQGEILPVENAEPEAGALPEP
jgi:hypothetical protein